MFAVPQNAPTVPGPDFKPMMTSRLQLVGFVLFLLLGSWCLYEDTPMSNRGEWPHVVLRNWHEFGFFRLHGQLVYNIAGQGLPQSPQIYSGHRPFSLYPAYLVTWLSGSDNGLWFHLLLSLAIGVGVWQLLGRRPIGLLAALLIVFSPGYLRMTPLLDPLDVPVLLAIPFFCRVRELLSREKISIGAVGLAVGLAAIYALLNWTTLLAFAIVLAYLAAALPGRFHRVLLFGLICGVAGGAVLAVSLISKAGHSAAAVSSGQMAQWYNHYLF